MNDQTKGHGGGAQFQPDPSMEKLKDRVSRITHKILVLSGKGGVGKSTVAVNTALALARAGKKVGLLDVDIHGPSIPEILGLTGERVDAVEEGILPVNYKNKIMVMSVGFLLQNRDDAVIWRGPLKYNVIKQFLGDVVWGDLDYLIVDAPPGTGDEPLSVAQFLQHDAGALIVTTPQQVAIADVRKSIRFCQKLDLRILGVVENMSGFVCPHCHETVNIFNTGGGETMAREMNIPFLGSIPLDPAIVQCGDTAESFLDRFQESPAALAYRDILEPILAIDAHRAHGQAYEPVETNSGPEDTIRVALPVANGRLCMHFGHCQVFSFLDVNRKTGAIISETAEEPPPHEPGRLPAWVHEKGATLVIAGGMGSRAKSLFEQQNIEVITGAPSESPRKIVEAYIAGALVTGDNVCDH